MDIPDPQAEFFAAHSKTEWTLALYDSFNGEYTVLSRHPTEAMADEAKSNYEAANKDVAHILSPLVDDEGLIQEMRDRLGIIAP